MDTERERDSIGRNRKNLIGKRQVAVSGIIREDNDENLS